MSKYISWNDLKQFMAYFLKQNQVNINYHVIQNSMMPHIVHFGAALIRIWNEVSPSITTNFDIKLDQAKADMRIEMDELKRANIDLKNQIKILEYQLKRLSPDMPMYDYAEIRNRTKQLHTEFRRICKLMKLTY
jgi:cell division protein FtsB